MATTAMSVMVPEDLAQRYDRLAQTTGKTREFYVTEALRDSIDRLEYECNILKKVEDFRAGRLETCSLDEVREDCGLAD